MKTYLFLVLALFLCFGTAQAETTFNRIIPATPGKDVSVEILAGELTIMGWDRSEVHIEGVLGDSVEDVEIDSDDDGVSIEVEVDEDNMTRNEGYANLDIHVPKDSKLELESVDVEIAVYDITGGIEIESISGNISIYCKPQFIEIESISGNLLIEGGADKIEIESVSGTISITGDRMTDVDIESVSGDVQFEGGLASDSNLSVENVSGSVLVRIPANISAKFDLSTFNGNFVSDFDEMKTEKDKFNPSKNARFSVGNGSGAEISVETFSGTIEIKQK